MTDYQLTCSTFEGGLFYINLKLYRYFYIVFEMGSKASLCLREEELAAIHKETGCKFILCFILFVVDNGDCCVVIFASITDKQYFAFLKNLMNFLTFAVFKFNNYQLPNCQRI